MKQIIKGIVVGILGIWLVMFLLGNLSSLKNNFCEESEDSGDYIFLVFKCIKEINTFNPDEDVCLEYKLDCYSKKVGNMIVFPTLENCPSKKCIDWREKNICELSPESEGCVCDEYKYDEGYYDYVMKSDDEDYIFNLPNYVDVICDKIEIYNNKMYLDGDCMVINENVCIKSHLPQIPIKIDLETEKCVENTEEYVLSQDGYHYCIQFKDRTRESHEKLFDKYCCIKKEPKNECEKGEEGWILECKRGCLIDNKCHHPCPNKNSKSGGGALEEPVCRPIQLSDYNCSELMKALYLQEEIEIPRELNTCEKGEVCVLRYSGWKQKYSINEIYDTAIEKGCNI